MGITALICIITVIEVLKLSIHDNFSSMGANTFTLRSESLMSKGGRSKHGRKRTSGGTKISWQQAQEFKKNYDYPADVGLSIKAASAVVIKTPKKTSNPNVDILGIDESYIKIANTDVIEGRNFSRFDMEGNNPVCLIGYNVGEEYYSSQEKAVDKYLQVGSMRARVVGVLEKKGNSMISRTDDMVFVTHNIARQRFDLADQSWIISASINDVKYLGLAMEEAEGAMRKAKKLEIVEDNNFSVEKNDALAAMFVDNIRYVTTTAAVIGLITLLGAAIGLMNIMLVAVAERTREIGVSKAIGATNENIRRQFLSESIYIGVKGGILGVIIGLLLGNLLSLFFKTPFTIPWVWIAAGLITCFLVGIIAGVYPAYKASKLSPIDALRWE